jgi:hypothetical protein
MGDKPPGGKMGTYHGSRGENADVPGRGKMGTYHGSGGKMPTYRDVPHLFRGSGRGRGPRPAADAVEQRSEIRNVAAQRDVTLSLDDEPVDTADWAGVCCPYGAATRCDG